MADYNSPYTGTEIDEAVAKTDKITEFLTVWQGAATTGDVLLSSLPINPGTGDRTGLYYVQLSMTAATPGSTMDPTFISTIEVITETGYSVGTSHSRFGEGYVKSQGAICYDGVFSGHEYYLTIPGNSFSNNPVYIHKIYRLQKDNT